MESISGDERRGALISATIMLLGLATLAFATTSSLPVRVIAPAVLLVTIVSATQRTLLEWHVLLGLLIVVILVIPIHRFAMPGNLPFELEPYRLIVLLIGAGWGASLLADKRVRLHLTGLEGPLKALAIVTVLSLGANIHRVANGLTSEVIKKISYLVSFGIILYILPSVIRRARHVDLLVKTLVWGASVVALLTVFEGRTHRNYFSEMHRILPFLVYKGVPYLLANDPRGRPYASSESPIALGAMFVMVLPLAIYLGRKTGQRRWWLLLGILVLGTAASRSRTAILMLIVTAIVLVALRPREVKRFWPALIPLVLVIHLASPGTFGAIKQSFFPKGGLVAQQANAEAGSGRVASLGPALKEWETAPLVGIGYGTRITDSTSPKVNAIVLDDQWLGTLLEVGLAGALAWVWIFIRFFRRQAALGRSDLSAQGWLPAGLAASAAAFALGMFTYDSFSFAQETCLMFVLFALGATQLPEEETAPVPPGHRRRERKEWNASRRAGRTPRAPATEVPRSAAGGGDTRRPPHRPSGAPA